MGYHLVFMGSGEGFRRRQKSMKGDYGKVTPPPQAVNSDLSLLRGSRGQTSPDELNLKIV